MNLRSLGLTPVLAAIAGVLLLVVYFDTADTGEPPAAAARRGEAAAPTAARPQPKAAAAGGASDHPLAAVRADELTETVARPLFEPTRRSTERPAVVAPAAAPPPPAVAGPDSLSVRLVGVVTAEGSAIAVLARDGAASLRVELGDFVDGWEVMKITPTEVTFARSGRQLAVKMTRR